jgi:SAM-dependent methyltransferase
MGWLRTFPEFAALGRVTSDAKPFPTGGELAICEACGTVQKPITAEWQAEADAIYGAYTIYHNAGGAEQNVFNGGGGQPASRSSRLVQQIRERVGLPERGRMLDLGCGNGAMLRSFSEQLPGWSLAGNELDDKNRVVIEAIPRVEKLYAGEIETVPGSFDAITLLHVLEHVPNPVGFLKRIAASLNSGGLVVVEVPDFQHSPFDLAVADHCTHFSLDTLVAVFEAAGLEIIAAAEDFIPKELTVVGRGGGVARSLGSMPSTDQASVVNTQLDWLATLAHQGRKLARANRLGVFGTSLGGAWLLGELGADVSFFVDEDSAKIGKIWAGRPILQPSEIPLGSHVLIGLPDSIAANIKARLDRQVNGPQFTLPSLARAA